MSRARLAGAIAVAFVAGAVAGYALDLPNGSSMWGAAEVAVLLATAGVIWWYTWETHHLRHATEAHAASAYMPQVVFDVWVGSEGVVRLRNLGPGIALNVTCTLTPAPMPVGERDLAASAVPWRWGTLLPGAETHWRVPHSVLEVIRPEAGMSADRGTLEILSCGTVPIEVSYSDVRGRQLVTLALLGGEVVFLGDADAASAARIALAARVGDARKKFVQSSGLGVGFPSPASE